MMIRWAVWNTRHLAVAHTRLRLRQLELNEAIPRQFKTTIKCWTESLTGGGRGNSGGQVWFVDEEYLTK